MFNLEAIQFVVRLKVDCSQEVQRTLVARAKVTARHCNKLEKRVKIKSCCILSSKQILHGLFEHYLYVHLLFFVVVMAH